MAIAEAFGAAVRQHFRLSFHIPEAQLAEMARAMLARGDRSLAPATLETH